MIDTRAGKLVGTVIVFVAVVGLVTGACGHRSESGSRAVQHDSTGTTSEQPATEEPTMDQAQHDLRVDYVELATTDMEATKKFYAGAFGWKLTDYGPDYTSFEDGRLSGGFRAEPNVTAGGPLIVIYAVDLEGTEAKIREAGGTIARDIFSFPGGRRFHFLDPSGNELAVWSDR